MKNRVIFKFLIVCFICTGCNVKDNKQESDIIPQQETVIEAQTYSVLEIQNMEPETVLDETMLNQELIDNLFYSAPISEQLKQRIWNISYKENDNISLEELRYLRVLYRGFDGNTHIGELIVNQNIAEDILEIMSELYRNDYPKI